MEITIEKINRAIKNIDLDEYDVVGWRVDEISLAVGTECRASLDFEGRTDEFDAETDDYAELSGTCAFSVAKDGEIEITEDGMGEYFDDMHIHIIAGTDGGTGSDAGEIIITDAVVIALG